MKQIDIYNKYKKEYKEYVVLIISGIFCYTYNYDIVVMHKIFNYKIKTNNNIFSVGFPKESINTICFKLEQYNINYIVINGDEIIDKYKSDNNRYNEYEIDFNRLLYINNRINNIYNKLSNNIFSSEIENILLNIEKLI